MTEVITSLKKLDETSLEHINEIVKKLAEK